METTGMRMPGRIARLAVIGATIGGAGAAAGAEFRDPKTGLAVNPPPGFTARLGKASMGDTVEIEVERETPPASCTVSFQESAANRSLTQQQINDMTGKPEWLELIRTAMGAMHEIIVLESRTQDGAVGAVLVVKPKMEMLAKFRTYQALFETPRGRTVVQCTASQNRFDGLRQDYDAITAGVTLPR
jgi:hypothetical protein